MTFAQQLRHMRGDLTQVAAARAINPDLPLATYQDWEQADAEGRGRREPPRWIQRTAIGKLALATGKPPIVPWDGCETMEGVRDYLGLKTRLRCRW